ncbi:MAG: PspA/IM30 family protein [Deltaproteobacteria bacterium]|nr:PspA/IM30 family protein [Deltaproteobacteria bacterium]
MGIFARLAQLIKSNLNDLISRSEDPEKMLNQIVVDMNTQLAEATKQVAVAIADEKRLAKQVESEAAQAAEWRRRAEMAVRAGNDELAKEGLQRKKEHDSLRAGYEQQWAKQKAAVDQLKTALRMLNNKIEEAKRKKNLLIAQKQRAEAQKAIHEALSGVKDQSAFETFDRMADKIGKMEAEAEASAELAEEYSGDVLKSKFDQLEATSGADEELLALKRSMGMAAPAPEVPAQVRVAGQDAPAAPAASEQTAEQKEQDELAQALAELQAEEASSQQRRMKR